MNDDRSLERAARSWIEAGPTQAPDRPVEAALRQIKTTQQERDLRIPWRLPTMTLVPRMAALAVVAAVALGGAILLAGRGSGVGSQPTPSPAPTPMTLAAYRSARDAICDAAIADTDPLKTDFGKFDGPVTASQRAKWIAALRVFAARQDVATDAWSALLPPTTFAEAHADMVVSNRDMSGRVRSIAVDLEAGRDTDALQVDQSTNILNAHIQGIEKTIGLHPCP